MWNVLLDKFPTEYEGFRIDEAFQTGIQISQALQDPDLSDDISIHAPASGATAANKGAKRHAEKEGTGK